MTTTSPTCGSCKVNVKLCGSMPRAEIDRLSLMNCAPLVVPSSLELKSSYIGDHSSLRTGSKGDDHAMSIDDGENVAAALCSQLRNIENKPLHKPEYEAPSWAVAASGEARLEPVFDSGSRQAPIDLTSRSVFRVGRSPSSDVQLLHATSSRKHAMLFHHRNGSCYIVDCNSAHGTFVNGLRVKSVPNDGVVVPHKIRRGSIVRFGGPGAPSFMLKSFSFGLDEMRDFSNTPRIHLSPTSAHNAEVEHNTRFNALGHTARSSLMMTLTSKRSFESISTIDEAEFDDGKAMRCTSPPLSPLKIPVRLVSPDFSQQSHKRRRVSFSSAPPKAFYPNLISPDLSSDENECEDNF